LATETYGSGANRSEAENPAPTPRVSIGPTPINDRAPAKVTPFPQPVINGDDPQKTADVEK
jgi:hypothetical protein